MFEFLTLAAIAAGAFLWGAIHRLEEEEPMRDISKTEFWLGAVFVAVVVLVAMTA